MAWDHDAKRAARNYINDHERKTFSVGYSDGFHHYAMWSSNDRDYYPNAYSAGFWEGRGDAIIGVKS